MDKDNCTAQKMEKLASTAGFVLLATTLLLRRLTHVPLYSALR